MGRMIFDLTDDDRSALEQLRAARGLRSHAEVLRALIRENTAGDFLVAGFARQSEVVIKGVREQTPKPKAPAPSPSPSPSPSPKVRKAAAGPLEATGGRLTMDDVRPKFVSRLKPDKPKR